MATLLPKLYSVQAYVIDPPRRDEIQLRFEGTRRLHLQRKLSGVTSQKALLYVLIFMITANFVI
jgi:hypothetical protein